MIVLEQVLKNAGVTFSEIERIVLCTGPGSFTGIRIGIALLKGLCFEKNVEIIEMTSLENIFEIGLEKDMNNMIYLSVIYANNDQIYMGVYDNSFSDKGRKIVECAGNIEECLEELYFKLNVNEYDLKRFNYNFMVIYDKDTKDQGKNLIKILKEKIEGKISGVKVEFKEVIVDNRGFDKRIKDINSGKYVLEDDEIKKEYEIIPNYLKKSQAKRLLEKNNKN